MYESISSLRDVAGCMQLRMRRMTSSNPCTTLRHENVCAFSFQAYSIPRQKADGTKEETQTRQTGGIEIPIPYLRIDGG